MKGYFFGLLQLVAADANTLYDHMKNYFNLCNISYENNLIGFASNGANVMMKARHSLAFLLKKDISSLS